MKRVASLIILALFIYGMLYETGAAQNRRRRSRPGNQTVESNKLSEAGSAASDEESARIIEECSLPDRPRPEAAIKARVLCGKAISLPRPSYPEEAKAAKVSGSVTVDIVIDEKGRVIWARATGGPALLQDASVKAACRARYTPTKISGLPVKVNSAISYNFLEP